MPDNEEKKVTIEMTREEVWLYGYMLTHALAVLDKSVLTPSPQIAQELSKLKDKLDDVLRSNY